MLHHYNEISKRRRFVCHSIPHASEANVLELEIKLYNTKKIECCM